MSELWNVMWAHYQELADPPLDRSKQIGNWDDEDSLRDPASQGLGQALSTWCDAMTEPASNALSCFLKLGFAALINHSHFQLVKLAYWPYHRGPTTCFLTSEGAAMPHDEVARYFQPQAAGLVPNGIIVYTRSRWRLEWSISSLRPSSVFA